MHAFKPKHPVPDLQPIDSVSLLGATSTAGDPQVAGAMTYGEPQDVLTCGLFSSTEGSFTMTYSLTEHATVLEDEMELTVAGGEPQCFAPGDSWFVKQGTEVGWKILTPRFVKHYLVNVEAYQHADNARRRKERTGEPGGDALCLLRAIKSHSAVAPVSNSAIGGFEAVNAGVSVSMVNKLKTGRTDRRPDKAQSSSGRNTRNVARRMAPVLGVMLFIHRDIYRPRHRVVRRSPSSGRYSLSKTPA